MKLNFKNKLYLLGAFLIFVNLLQIGATFYSQSKMAHFDTISRHVNAVNFITLQNRRREKDFFLRFKLKYQDDVRKQTREIKNHLVTLQQMGLDPEINHKLTKLDEHITAYAEQFYTVVGLYLKRGLNEQTGLRGELREKVHNIEDTLKEDKKEDLMSAMLMLRRREKDYLLRLDSKYINKLEDDYKVFLNILNKYSYDEKKKDKIKIYGDAYIKVINEVALIDEEIVNNVKELREIIHKVEPEVTYIAGTLEQLRKKQTSFITTSVTVITGLSVVVVVLLLLRMFTSMVVPLVRFKSLLLKAQNGDFSVRFPVRDKDEDHDKTDDFSQVGLQFNQLMQMNNTFFAKVTAMASGDSLADIHNLKLPEKLQIPIRDLQVMFGELENQLTKRTLSLDIPDLKDQEGFNRMVIHNTLMVLAGLSRQTKKIAFKIHSSGHSRLDGEEKISILFDDLTVLLRGLSDEAGVISHLLRRREDEVNKLKKDKS